jgi:two-component system, response regulator PdtaR
MISLESAQHFGMKLWLGSKTPGGRDDPEQRRHMPAADAAALRLLIVEDEFYIALDIEALLAGLGHSTVGIAVSADQAVNICERERPDLVLMDIRLVGTRDGIDAAGEILARFGIRSVFITANTDPHTRHRAAAINPIGFLEKPLAVQSLRAALNSLKGPT